MYPSRILIVLVSLLASTSAYCQEPVPSEVVRPDLRVEVTNLPTLGAGEDTPAELAAIRIVLQAENIRCDERSELETAARTVSDHSLKNLITKIAGTSCATRRGPVKIEASFVPAPEIRGDDVLATLLQRKPLLVQFQGAVLVLYGATYDEHLRSDGSRMNVVRTFVMLDPRYLARRRSVTFIRDKDNFDQIRGVATLQSAIAALADEPSRRSSRTLNF